MSEPFHGLLLVNKEPGCTSHDVVARTRRILNTKSVGHCGTLDPIAGGLMVLLIGEATKLSNYILEGDKAYRAVAKLGVSTDTLDVTGQVLESKPVEVTEAQIRKAVESLQGEFDWEVPIFSAAKVDGKKLYEYARSGETVARPVKKMKFWDVKIVSIGSDQVEVDITCSKGSFIRSWIQHLGEILGCGAAMSALQRTSSVPFRVERAIDLEQLQRLWSEKRDIGEALVPMDQALPGVKRILVKGPDQALLLNGQISHDLRSLLITQARPESPDELIQVHSSQRRLLALVGLEQGRGFAIRRVFKYS